MPKQRATCESCGESAEVDFEAGKAVEVTDPEGAVVPARVSPEGWLQAGEGGAWAVLAFCPKDQGGFQIAEVTRG